MRFAATGPDKIRRLEIRFNRSEDARGTANVAASKERLDLTGCLKHIDPAGSEEYSEEYLLFQGSLRVISDGVITSSTSGTPSLTVEGAQQVTIIVSAATNFGRPAGQSSAAAVNAAVESLLDGAVAKGYAGLLSEHTAAFRSIMQRVNLSLGTTAAAITALPTSERVRRARLQVLNGTTTADEDPGLFTLLFQFGRYLLASSSNPASGSHPANLQGVWNGDFDPNWNSEYTTK
jgi:hypothetical protein